MKFLQRSLTGLGGITLAGLLLTVAVPKAVHAVASVLVQVTNTTANPVINSRMDHPGRIPYQAVVNTPISPSGTSSLCGFLLSTVPANHRLVVDNIGGFVPLSAASAVFVNLGCNACGEVRFNGTMVPSPPTGPTTTAVEFSLPVHLYFDPGEVPEVTVQVANLSTVAVLNGVPDVTVSGYLLDCAAAPCAPIAH
jgi:hypothetical protein